MELVVVRSAASPTRPRRVSLPAVVRPLAAAVLVVAGAELHRVLVAVAEIRRISLGEQLSYESKLDRSPAFIERLTARGIEEAEAFLDDLGDGHEHAAQFGFSHDEDRRRERPDYGGE